MDDQAWTCRKMFLTLVTLLLHFKTTETQGCGVGCAAIEGTSDPWQDNDGNLIVSRKCFLDLGSASIPSNDLNLWLEFSSTVAYVKQWTFEETSSLHYYNKYPLSPDGLQEWSMQIAYPGTIVYWPVKEFTTPPEGTCRFTIGDETTAQPPATTTTTQQPTTTTPEPTTTTETQTTTTPEPTTTTTSQQPTTTTPEPTTTTETLTTTTPEPTTTTTSQQSTTTQEATTTTQSVTTTEEATVTTTSTSSGSRAYSDVTLVSEVWQENGLLVVEGRCTFSLQTTYAAGEASMRLTLDSAIEELVNWNFNIDTPSTRPASDFYLTNYGTITTNPFHWNFHMYFSGTLQYVLDPATGNYVPQSTPSPPTGVCEFISNTGVTPPPQTTSDPGQDTTAAPETTAAPGTTQEPTDPSDRNFDVCRNYSVVTSQDNVWTYNYYEVLCKSILFYEAQRSGALPDNQRVTWRKNSALDDGYSSVGVDLTGGWYDAGDTVKFGFPMAHSVTVLLWGFLEYREAYDAAGQTEFMFDSIKWPLDYFLKCWFNDTQTFYAQVGDGDIDHAVLERPEEMTSQRPAYYVNPLNPGSDIASSTASALAAGYLAFRDRDIDYANQLLTVAEELYDFAINNRGLYSDSIPDADQFYRSYGGDKDEVTEGAAWLYRATGDNYYLNLAETLYNDMDSSYIWSYDWTSKDLAVNLHLFELTQNSKYSNVVRTYLQRCASGNDPSYTPGGLAYRDEWGPLVPAANNAFATLKALGLGIVTQTEIDSGTIYNPVRQIHYVLGDNPHGYSYIVGFGTSYPLRPHHKSSLCAPSPAQCDFALLNSDAVNYYTVYGAMVGGPDANDYYGDDRSYYQKSEVGCVYNAGLQSAVAGIIYNELFPSK